MFIGAVKRAMAMAVSAELSGERTQEHLERVSRRGFMKLGVSAMVAGPLWMSAACTSTPDRPQVEGEGVQVAIIGAGMAGLHCAYSMKRAGVIAQVYEGSSRLGGRMFSARQMFADGQVAELGGELIDTGHGVMQALAKEFSIQLDDLWEGEPEGYRRETFFIGGRVYSEEEIIEAFRPTAAAMLSAMEEGEASEEAVSKLDKVSIKGWLESVGASELVQTIVDMAYTGQFGMEIDQQSCLNLLYSIDYKDLSQFGLFGESDERFHTNQGNDLFITKLAEALGPGQVSMGHMLKELSKREDGRYELLFRVSGSDKRVVAERVVLAIPFTTLREVKLDGAGLSDKKLRVIRELGYGMNTKLMVGFRERVWHTKHNASGTTVTDNGLQATWDTARGQAGAAGIITNFVGGDLAIRMGEGEAKDYIAGVSERLDEVYPGAKAVVIEGMAARMHWPSAPFAKGSYACYKVGQWSSLHGEEGTQEDKVYFCGEHCSEDFQGYMEGAAETGGIVAKKILEELNIEASAGVLRVIDERLQRKSYACYHGRLQNKLSMSARRRLMQREALAHRGAL
jgi:monoamine oxidase